MEKKSIFFDLDRTKIVEGNAVPAEKMTENFVTAFRNGNEKKCKKGCPGCKIGLKKETSGILVGGLENE